MNRKSRLTIPVMILVCVCPSAAAAVGYIAKTPHSIRQTYLDNSYTEMACTDDDVRSMRQACTFVVGVGRSTKVYKFSIDKLGYHDFIQSYGYFVGAGTDFSVKFQVTCTESDLALYPGADLFNSSCHLTMKPKGSELAPLSLDVTGEVGGRNFRRGRFFAPDAK